MGARDALVLMLLGALLLGLLYIWLVRWGLT